MNAIQKMFKIRILDDSVYFKVAFLFWAIMHTLALGQYYTSYLSPIMMVWGGLIVLKNIFIDKIKFPKKYLILMYGFLIAYVITILINFRMSLFGNIKTLIWMAIELFALFITDLNKSKEEIYSDIVRISRATIIATLILALIALVQFVMGTEFWVHRVDGREMPQGYYAARLWGLFVDPNQACNLSLVSMALSFVLLALRRGLFKWILIINIICQYLYILLSGSRGGEIGLAVLLVGSLYLVFEKFVNSKANVSFLKVIASFILSIAVTGAILVTFEPQRKALAIIPETVYKVQHTVKEKVSSIKKTDTTEKKETTKKDDARKDVTVVRPDAEGSNGRLELWRDGLKLAAKYPIFGVGDRNIMELSGKLFPGSSTSKQYVHNGYIHMLLSGGAVSLIVMMSLVIMIGFVAFKKIFQKKNNSEEYFAYGHIIAMIASLLVTSFFITELFFQNSFTAATFWIFTGYIVYFIKHEKFTV